MKIVYWGTYDTGKPRNRIFLKGLTQNGVDVIQINSNIWQDVEDKSQIKKNSKKILLLFYWLFSYPSLIYRYLRSPAHSCVMIGYLGHLDVLILWPFAKMRGVPVVWDAFISLYDTVVLDRKMVTEKNFLARGLFLFEWLVCKAADRVVLDTEAHAEYFIRQYNLSRKKCVSIFVGAEQDNFPQVQGAVETTRETLTVLFYGQCIPLHGIDVILEAISYLKSIEYIKWILIGSGQDDYKIKSYLQENTDAQVQWFKWIDYTELSAHIRKADICLGIFGKSEKASRVIPNKVFQIISCGKTLITRTSPGIKEIFEEDEAGVFLVEPGSGKVLAEKILFLDKNRDIFQAEPHFTSLRVRISPKAVSRKLKNLFLSID